MIELKKCPFCGGEGKLKSINDKGDVFMFVQCTECGGSSEMFVFKNVPTRMDKNRPVFDKVRAAWNRRVDDA